MKSFRYFAVSILVFSAVAPVFASGTYSSTITNAVISDDYDSITVQLSSPIEKGYIEFQRWGSGNGYDYGSFQYRADNKKKVVLTGILQEFARSGTTGKQTITLRACIELAGARDGSTSCGAAYPLTIDLGGSASFRDVSDAHPNTEAIRFVQVQGIVAGYPDGTFLPDSTINRAEFTKIITLALFGQTMIDQCGSFYSFSDVPRDAWYAKHVCRARDGWLLTGYPDNTFRPANSINFVEAAKILANGYDLVQNSPECGKLCFDTDTPEHPWYERYVRALADKNAIPLSLERFDQPITRGEMAEMIYRLKEITNKPSKTYEQLTQTLP